MPYVNGFITRGWLPCNGQLLPVSQFSALYSLLGVTYGGSGNTSFALPNLNGRAAMGPGANYPQGAAVGTENVTLSGPQMPAHTHALTGSVAVNNTPGSTTSASPQGNYFGQEGAAAFGSPSGSGNMGTMLSGVTQAVGGNQPHENRMPYLALGYFIAIQGEYPQRQ